MTRQSRILEKLAALRRLDDGCVAHGAESHRYQLEPVLGQDEVLAFEREFNVRLPEEYADFLVHLGNGGAGPGYGLYPLSKAADEFRGSQAWAADRKEPVRQLDRPFPLTAAVADALIACRSLPFWGSFTPHVSTKHGLDGIFDIAHGGCTAYQGLVAVGEQRGCVWFTGGAPNNSWGPIGKGPGSSDFLAWYEAWLDEWLAPGAIERWAKATGRAKAGAGPGAAPGRRGM